MNRTGTLYTTADGWTIDIGHTIAARAALWVRNHGGKAKAAAANGISLHELRQRLTDQRLDPAPVVTPEAKAVLSKPLPVLDVPPDGEATEADMLRLCEFIVAVASDYQKLDWVMGWTSYNPPAEFEAVHGALWNLYLRAEAALAAIPATTLAGIRAKGRALMTSFDPAASDLNDVDLVNSILADCGVDDWKRVRSSGWTGETDGTVRVSGGEPVSLQAVGASLAA